MRTNLGRFGRSTLLAPVAAVAILAGCGSDDDTNDPSDDVPGEVVPGDSLVDTTLTPVVEDTLAP